jgi:hypothetical protein
MQALNELGNYNAELAASRQGITPITDIVVNE